MQRTGTNVGAGIGTNQMTPFTPPTIRTNTTMVMPMSTTSHSLPFPTTAASTSHHPPPSSITIPHSSTNPRRSCLLHPRVLVFALLFLTLTATFLSYTLFVDPSPQYMIMVDDQGNPNKLPDIPVRSIGDNWMRRPLEANETSHEPTKEDTKSNLTELRTNLSAEDDDPMAIYSQCHNSKQGRKLVTDDSGTICARQHVLKNGCCRQTKQIDKLSCGMCRTDVQCCRSYEYCVSCCLRSLPDTDRASDSVAVAPRFSFHSFDKCLHLCRTSSRSIKHGNTYRTPVLRHCYTEGDHVLPLKFEESATVLVAQQGVSCTRTCASYRGLQVKQELEESDTPSVQLPPPSAPPLYICHEAFLPSINKCDILKKYFNCANDKCDLNAGNDQPALVINEGETMPTAASSALPSGQCLLNGDDKLFDCEGHHESTRRLCACIQADQGE